MAHYAGVNTVLKDSTEREAGIEQAIAATAKRIKMLEATIPAVSIWKQLKERKNMTIADIDKIIDEQVRLRQHDLDRRHENMLHELQPHLNELNEADSMVKLQYLMLQEKLIMKRINELERKEQKYKNVLENVIVNKVKPCLQTLKNLPSKLKNICDCKQCDCSICVQKNDFLAAGQKFEEEKQKRIDWFEQQQREKFENDIANEEEMKLKQFQTRKKFKDKDNYICIDSCWRKNIEEIAFKLSTSLNGIMKNYPDIQSSLIEQLKDVTTTVNAAAKIIKLREKHGNLKRANKNLNTKSNNDRLKNENTNDPHLCAIINYAREQKFCNMKPDPSPLPNYCQLCDRENCLHISPCCKSDNNLIVKSRGQCYIKTTPSCVKKPSRNACAQNKSKCSDKHKSENNITVKSRGQCYIKTTPSCSKKPSRNECAPIKSKCSHKQPCSYIHCPDSVLIRDSSKFHKSSNDSFNLRKNEYKNVQNTEECKLTKSHFSCVNDLLTCNRHSASKVILKCNLEPPCICTSKYCKSLKKSSHMSKYKLSSSTCFHTPKCTLQSKIDRKSMPCQSRKHFKHSVCTSGACNKKIPEIGADQKINKCGQSLFGKSPCFQRPGCNNCKTNSCVLAPPVCCKKEIDAQNIKSTSSSENEIENQSYLNTDFQQ